MRRLETQDARIEAVMTSRVIIPRQQAPAATGAPTPIVLGGGMNGLSAVRSLAQAGLRPIVVVDRKYDLAAMSRHAQRVTVPTFDGEDFADDLIRLREGMPNGGVIIFADDRPLLTVSRYRDRVAPCFGLHLPRHDLLDRK